MNELSEWFKGLPTWGKVGVVAGAGGLILYIWHPWGQSATAPTTVTSELPSVAGGSPSGTNSSVSSDISSMLASSQDATAKMLGVQQTQVADMMTAQAKTNADMLNTVKDAQTAQANAVHQELTDQKSAFNLIVASLDHPGNHYTDPAPVPHYVAPGAPPSMQNWSQYETADRNKYNLIGGGATSIKPPDTMIANGNVIKYDNGPHGWTEYDTTGKGIRWGTASPY